MLSDSCAKPKNGNENNSITYSTQYVSYTRFSPEQFEMLERVYNANSYPNTSIELKLAANFKVKPSKVKNWFKRRRQKQKEGKSKFSLYVYTHMYTG